MVSGFDDQPTQAIGDIEVDKKDPDIVWVGTGESLLSKTSFPGIGVFKSTYAGETWQNMGLHDSYHIGRIAIDYENYNVVYVAAMGHPFAPNEEKGLFKTVDGGENWERVLHVNGKTGVTDVIIDPENSDRIYAAAWQNISGEGSAIYRSEDGGLS